MEWSDKRRHCGGEGRLWDPRHGDVQPLQEHQGEVRPRATRVGDQGVHRRAANVVRHRHLHSPPKVDCGGRGECEQWQRVEVWKSILDLSHDYGKNPRQNRSFFLQAISRVYRWTWSDRRSVRHARVSSVFHPPQRAPKWFLQWDGAHHYKRTRTPSALAWHPLQSGGTSGKWHLYQFFREMEQTGRRVST